MNRSIDKPGLTSADCDSSSSTRTSPTLLGNFTPERKGLIKFSDAADSNLKTKLFRRIVCEGETCGEFNNVIADDDYAEQIREKCANLRSHMTQNARKSLYEGVPTKNKFVSRICEKSIETKPKRVKESCSFDNGTAISFKCHPISLRNERSQSLVDYRKSSVFSRLSLYGRRPYSVAEENCLLNPDLTHEAGPASVRSDSIYSECSGAGGLVRTLSSCSFSSVSTLLAPPQGNPYIRLLKSAVEWIICKIENPRSYGG